MSYDKFPEQLIDFLTVIGSGTVGTSTYQLYGLQPSQEKPDTRDLLLIGDDFSGNIDAISPNDGWEIGSIYNGAFESDGDTDICEYLASIFI
jgi:hypothetical protein